MVELTVFSPHGKPIRLRVRRAAFSDPVYERLKDGAWIRASGKHKKMLKAASLLHGR